MFREKITRLMESLFEVACSSMMARKPPLGSKNIASKTEQIFAMIQNGYEIFLL